MRCNVFNNDWALNSVLYRVSVVPKVKQSALELL
jgi:hypothetical protein